MQKKISITLLFTVVISIVALFAYSEVIAGGDCSVPPDPMGTCYEFSQLKHKIEFLGVFDAGGLKEFRYRVTKTGNINLNHWNFGIPVCKSGCIVIQDSFPDANQYPACVGDPATDVGIGDCEHCWTRLQRALAKNDPEIWYFRVNPPEKINTIPIHLKSGNDYEFGYILGPACVEAELIEQTQVVVTTAEGGKLRITTDREGNIITLEEWDPNCNNGEGCWVPVSFDTIPQEEVLVCVPYVDGDPGPTYIDGEPYYCDFVRYITDGTDSWAGSGSLCGKFVCGSFVRYPCR